MPRRPAVIAAALAAAVGGLPGAAQAHSAVIGTDPAEGATLAKSPAAVTIRFNEPIRHEFAYAKVTSGDGRSVEPVPAVDGAALVIRLAQPLPNGRVTVAYRVASEDTHPVSGALHFTVAAPAPATSPADTSPAATSSAGTSPGSSPSRAVETSGAAATATTGASAAASPAEGNGGPSTGFWLLVFVLGLGAAAAGWLAGRRVRRR